EKFEAKTGNQVLVSGLGSSAGIEAVISGTADIASSSRDLTKEEASHELVSTVIAHDGIAIIVNDSNPVKNVTLDQLRDIYAGKITNWKELGGPDLAIQLVNRDEASGTREAFRSIVMRGAEFDRSAAVLPGTGQVRDVVSRSKGAIGYISIGFVKSDFATTTVRTLTVNGVKATEDNVSNGKYPISRDLYFFTNGDPQGVSYQYIRFVLSDQMTKTIEEAGYIPVNWDQSAKGDTTSTASTDDASTSGGEGK
ncbi:MAG: phosphate ABC transporter substrate-binding protein, partial [Parafannyhessea sp.]|uniref:phosphate ABC transporter substrate-binding protein n=1 Tax=Parafannyhessea sp. TaxID=2847324 RepID=UPI003F0FEF52